MNNSTTTKRTPRIAIVDDDGSSRESTQLLLRSAGYCAEVFASAREFLGSVRPGETACVILDLCMPGMDGLELQGRLSEAHLQIPIIFITAHATENEEQRARKAGAVDFLRKPVNEEELLNAIETALTGRENDERTQL